MPAGAGAPGAGSDQSTRRAPAAPHGAPASRRVRDRGRSCPGCGRCRDRPSGARRPRRRARRPRRNEARERRAEAPRLRRMVSHDSPDWNPSRQSRSSRAASSVIGRPHSSSWYGRSRASTRRSTASAGDPSRPRRRRGYRGRTPCPPSSRSSRSRRRARYVGRSTTCGPRESRSGRCWRCPSAARRWSASSPGWPSAPSTTGRAAPRPRPLAARRLVDLALWMAAEYCSTPARALVARLCRRRGARAKTALWAEAGGAGGERLNDAQRALLDALPRWTGADLAALRRLEARGLVRIVPGSSAGRPHTRRSARRRSRRR